jgi:CubicO group peptidase (beta-lactamase class C family)
MKLIADGLIPGLDTDVLPLVSSDLMILSKALTDMDVAHGPVTFSDLLTHSGGFEDKLTGLFTKEMEVEERGESLDPMPQRVRMPGEAYAYSNHGRFQTD